MRNLAAIALTAAALGAALASDARACDVRVRPDGNTAAIQHAMDRPSRRPIVVCLAPGVYRGARLVASRSVVLRRQGRDKVVLDAGGQGRVLTVTHSQIDVRLEGLTLTNGRADRGGAVALTHASRVRLEDCWLYANTATVKGGGAVYADAGTLELVRVRVTGSSGDRAAALDLAGSAHARVVATLLADNEARSTSDAAVRLSGSAQAELWSTTIAYNSGSAIALQPDGSGARRLAARSCVIMGKPDAIGVSRADAANVIIERSVVLGGTGFVALDLATRRAVPGFGLKGSERYRPEAASAAIDLGDCSGPDGGRDLVGARRPRPCTAGALEAPAADVTATRKARQRDRPQAPRTWRDL